MLKAASFGELGMTIVFPVWMLQHIRISSNQKEMEKTEHANPKPVFGDLDLTIIKSALN